MDPAAGLVAGETLIDLFPAERGPLAEVSGFRHRPGGAPANVAVALAKLGDAPRFWTRLVSDDFGAYLGATLADAGVPVDHVRTVAGKTPLAVVTPAPDGDRSFSFYEPDTALAFDPEYVPEVRGQEWVALGGVPLVSERGREAFFALAEGADATVFFDPNTRLDLWADRSLARDVFERALAATDVLVTSADDLVVYGIDPERAHAEPESVAADLIAAGPHTVFLTRGGEDAVVVSDATGVRRRARQSVLDVEVVDTTGAGDAFTAGVVARFEPEADLDGVLRYANAVAGLTTTAEGAMAALPTSEVVADLL
jgi:fructokinase